MATVIAVSNQKGGVGKTSTAINLAAAVAQHGHRTLLIDLDPQGNATSGLGVARDELELGVYHALVGEHAMAEVVVATAIEDLALAPSTMDMMGAEVELMQAEARETRLRQALAALDQDYAFVFLDCPPSLGFITVNALAAADSVLIPVQAEYLALEGLGQLMRTLAEVRKSLNPRLVREGEVVTLFDRRNKLCHDVEQQLRQVFGDEVFRTVIPRNVRLAEAPSYGQSVLTYAPGSLGARAYLELAMELLSRRSMPSVRKEAM